MDAFFPLLLLTLWETQSPQNKRSGCSFPQSLAMMWCSGTDHWLTLHLKRALSKILACALSEVSCYLQPVLHRPGNCPKQYFLLILLKQSEHAAAIAPPTSWEKRRVKEIRKSPLTHMLKFFQRLIPGPEANGLRYREALRRSSRKQWLLWGDQKCWELLLIEQFWLALIGSVLRAHRSTEPL